MDAEFQRLDRDSNGMIVAEVFIASQREAAQAEAIRPNQQVFASLDRDGDGRLNPQEFAALANPSAIPTDATPLMTQLDSDRDGVITLVEYRVATQTNFDRIDSDRDGVITEMVMRAAGIQPSNGHYFLSERGTDPSQRMPHRREIQFLGFGNSLSTSPCIEAGTPSSAPSSANRA